MANTPSAADGGEHVWVRRVWIDGQRHYLTPATAGELRHARRGLGLSFRAAARRTGVSAGHMCDLEHCRRAPSIEVAQALVDGLRMDAGPAAMLMAEAVPDAGRSWRPLESDEQAA